LIYLFKEKGNVNLMKKQNAGVRIKEVVPTPIHTEKAWVGVIKAFNPFGPAAEAYAQTLKYRIYN
jgi:hypothetical protein